MRTSFHHQPEAQHPNFPLSASWQADYPIFRGQSGLTADVSRMPGFDPKETSGTFRWMRHDPDLLMMRIGPCMLSNCECKI